MRVQRLIFVHVVGVAVLLASRSAPAQVVVLRTSDLAPYKALEQSFSAAVGESTQSFSLAEPDAKARFASARQDSKVVLAIGPEAAQVAAATTQARLVVALVPSPGALGLKEASVVPMFVPPARQLRHLKSVLPSAATVGLVYDPALSKAMAAEYEAAATAAGLKVVRTEVPGRAAVAEGVRSMVGKVDVLWLMPDSTVISTDTFKLVMQISLASKLPVAAFTSGMAKAGALLSVAASNEEMGQRAGAIAKRLLAGQAAPTDGIDGSLYLNAKVAELLGISLSDQAKSGAATVF